MPSKDFLYLASSLFWGIFPPIIYEDNDSAWGFIIVYCNMQISMYTIFPCYSLYSMIYFVACKLTYSISISDFRMSA